MLEAALNVLDNLVFVDRAKYEAPKEKRKLGRPAKAKEAPKRKFRTYTTTLEGKMAKINSGGGSPMA
jgi:hypothetical protein